MTLTTLRSCVSYAARSRRRYLPLRAARSTSHPAGTGALGLRHDHHGHRPACSMRNAATNPWVHRYHRRAGRAGIHLLDGAKPRQRVLEHGARGWLQHLLSRSSHCDCAVAILSSYEYMLCNGFEPASITDSSYSGRRMCLMSSAVELVLNLYRAGNLFPSRPTFLLASAAAKLPVANHRSSTFCWDHSPPLLPLRCRDDVWSDRLDEY